MKNLIKKENEIILTLKVDKKEACFFLNNNAQMNDSFELNKSNTILYINGEIYEFTKYFIPRHLSTRFSYKNSPDALCVMVKSIV